MESLWLHRRSTLAFAAALPLAARAQIGPAILADVRDTFAMFSDFRADVAWVEPAGANRLVKQFRFQGKWTGPFPAGRLAAKPPSGRAFSVEVSEFRDGRIAATDTYYDRVSLLAQIGALGG